MPRTLTAQAYVATADAFLPATDATAAPPMVPTAPGALVEALTATPDVALAGTYPGSTTFPGSDTYPGRGNDLSESSITPRTLTAVSA